MDWGPIISFLLAVIACLMGIVVKQNSRLAEKVDEKVDEKSCEAYHRKTEKETEGLWGALNNHSHVGLPPDSRVIRG
jgi:hypothetical protein